MDDCSESVVGDGRVGKDFGGGRLSLSSGDFTCVVLTCVVLNCFVFLDIFRQVEDFVFQGVSSG